MEKKYDKQWSSANPGLLIILVDQSGSMLERMPGVNQSRTEYASMAVNRVIYSIINKSFSGTTPKNRAFISVLGYNHEVREIASDYIQELAAKPLRIQKVTKKIPDGAGGLIDIEEEMPIWVEPIDRQGTTNMKGAFELARQIIEKWISAKPDSPAPVIINISDGVPYWSNKNVDECMDETAEVVKKVSQLSTSDGNVLIFNACIGDGVKTVFPAAESEVYDEEGKFLFRISSVIPEGYEEAALKQELPLKDGAKGCISGADAVDLIKLIDFGSSKGQVDIQR